MKSDKEPILINIESPTPSDLNFQEFPKIPTNKASAGGTHYKSTFILSDGPIGNGEQTRHSIWSMEYFQKFFDINTDMVVDRIKGSVWPKPGIIYMQHHLQSKPDLYGPFWICITLIFTIAISGNMANYLQSAGDQTYHWKYDFHTVTASATLIFFYAWFLPVVWWGLLKVYGNEHFQPTLLELICVYGYSLSVYIPIAVLWTIQIDWMQWTFLLIGTVISAYVLVTSISPAFGSRSYIFVLLIILFKIILALSFMLHFFHVPRMHSS